MNHPVSFWGLTALLVFDVAMMVRAGRRSDLGSMILWSTAAVLSGVFLTSLPAEASVEHWGMNERKGSVLHDSTRHPIDGHIGKHVNLDGHSHGFTPIRRHAKRAGRIDVVQDSPRLDPGGKFFAVTVRFKWPRNADNNLIQKGQGSPAGGLFKMKTTVPAFTDQPPGHIKCLFRGSKGDSQVESYEGHRLDNNRWHTVRCVRDRHGTRMSVDGRLIDRNLKDPGVISNDWPIAIGGNTYCPQDTSTVLDCNYWWGRIADIHWQVGR